MKNFTHFFLIVCVISTTLLLASCNSSKQKIRRSDDLPEKYKLLINNQKQVENFQGEILFENGGGRFLLPYSYQVSFSSVLIMEHVQEDLGIDYLRNNNGALYSIHPFENEMGEKGYCIISYNDVAVIDSWPVITIPNKMKFQKLEIGRTTFRNIKEYDPAACLDEDAVEPSSYHRFLDGSTIDIFYQKQGEDYIVKEYTFRSDPVDVIKNLLPMDLKLII